MFKGSICRVITTHLQNTIYFRIRLIVLRARFELAMMYYHHTGMKILRPKPLVERSIFKFFYFVSDLSKTVCLICIANITESFETCKLFLQFVVDQKRIERSTETLQVFLAKPWNMPAQIFLKNFIC